MKKLVQIICRFFFDQKLVPHLVSASSKNGSDLAWLVGRYYQSTLLYQYDPNIKIVNRSSLVAEDFLVLRLKASEIKNDVYRKEIYEGYKLIDRISIMSQFNSKWFAINFYRDKIRGEFSDEATEYFRDIADVVITFLCKQYELLPTDSWNNITVPSVSLMESIVSRVCGKLSQREKQVCARALVGVTNQGIALELGVKMSTVATLRKRAFVKLNISSLNELFALCLAQAFHSGE